MVGPLWSSSIKPLPGGRTHQGQEGCVQPKPVTILSAPCSRYQHLRIPSPWNPQQHLGLHSFFLRSKLVCWESIQGVSAEGRVGLSLDFWPKVSTDLRPASHRMGWNKVGGGAGRSAGQGLYWNYYLWSCKRGNRLVIWACWEVGGELRLEMGRSQV